MFDVSHWAMLVTGMAFGLAVGMVLVKVVHRKGLEEQATLGTRLCKMESWLKRISAAQEQAALKDMPKERPPWKWTV
jgi:hypothetical protein